MVQHATIPGDRLVTLLEPAVVGLIDTLGLDQDATAELVGLVAMVPPEERIALLLGVYDELAAADVEPAGQEA